MKKIFRLIMLLLIPTCTLIAAETVNTSSSSANFLKAATSKYNLGANPFTLLFWSYIPTGLAQTNLVTYNNDTCGTFSDFNVPGDTKIHAFISPTNCTQLTSNGTAGYQGNTWNVHGMVFNGLKHWCAIDTSTADGRTVQFVCVDNGTNITPFVGTNPALIAGGVQNNSFNIGYIGIWNIDLTSTEIQAFVNSASPTQIRGSLIGFYPLDSNGYPEVDLSPTTIPMAQQGTVATTPSTFPHGQANMQRMKHY